MQLCDYARLASYMQFKNQEKLIWKSIVFDGDPKYWNINFEIVNFLAAGYY
jgi:hypothetical protein